MSSLPPKPDFDSRDDDRRSPPRRPERSDHDRRASSSRGPPPLADSYIAPSGDTYVPRHDERSHRPSPPPRSWRDPPRRDPPPRREEWRHRDEPVNRRHEYPPRSRDYFRGGPRDRDWRRDRDYDDRDRRSSRRSPSPYDRDRRWSSRGSPSPPRRSSALTIEKPSLQCSSMQSPTTAYDYRRRPSPYHPRRSASPPPRYRRPSPGRREDGRPSPRRPPRDDNREGRQTSRRSRSHSQTRSRTPRSPALPAEVQPADPTSEVSASAPVQEVDISPTPTSPHCQKPANQPGDPSETHVSKPPVPVEVAPEPMADADVTMVDVQPPTQPKAFAASTTAPPTQPRNFNRPPPTGPRLVPTATGQLHPPHQPPIPETSSTPAPAQCDTCPSTTDTPITEEPTITLPQIGEFTLAAEEKDRNRLERLEKTVNHIQSHAVSFFLRSGRSPNSCEKVT